MSLTDVPGIRVGHWTDAEARTGCTVIVPPSPNVAAVEVRGAAPATREVALLAPGMKVQEINALLLTGGSAFGLAAADGVVRELERDGIGHETPVGRVPIVPAAVIFDLAVGSAAVRPNARAGAAAYRSATEDPVASQALGVAAGATAGKMRGFEHAVPTVLGNASRQVGNATVAALAVVNAVGEIDPDFDAPLPDFPDTDAVNTTLAVLATDAQLGREDLVRLCVRAHDAFAATIYPVHTRYDGDAVFALSCGPVSANLDQLGEAAFAVTREALRNAAGR